MDASPLPIITFPPSASPRVSILIPTTSRADRLQRCLEALRENISTDISYEVVLMLNAAQQDVVDFAQNCVRGVVIARSSVNLGVAGGNNRARKHASGEFLVLLHDDTEVRSGWLESLVEVADRHPEAGIVGSRIFNPDGTLQAEGWVLWQNAQTTPPWGDGPPEASRSDDLRAVDYTPTCSLLARASTWDAVGGLDENIYPAYFVDVDFCLTVRSHGWTVLCQPRSQLMHHRGSSSKREFREFMALRNREYFVKKWSHVLASQLPFPESQNSSTGLIEAQNLTDSIARDIASTWKKTLPAPPSSSATISDAEHDLAHLQRQFELTSSFSTLLQKRMEQTLQKTQSRIKAKTAEARRWRRLASNLKTQLRDIKKTRSWRWRNRLIKFGRRIRHLLGQ
ncbi:glycosyltransferase family 2 protein [Phragmitibacter flavus]|uniref:Glycosyltransferase family 2 protein n=1 Tax=Phragmitibacter flavus TaxID=2576071 RepID=A0A5R8KC39_9BACT|nr:glycosyltransferase [Phragmitibacter flavus]TLD69797.1 glycosyltransferase family 2 protein [Phragmitibacter flavus]